MFDFGIFAALGNATQSVSDANLTSLSCGSSNSCPGIYDNAFGDLGNFFRFVSSFFLLIFDPTDSSAHTWNPPASIDANSVDAPYSSYATNGDSYGGGTALTSPGVYDNALNDLGATCFFVWAIFEN